MAEKKWTPEQKAAIESVGGSLLLSAAAGSGKTAVLVERVVRMLLDEEHPVDADRLLVVTFSNAAAKEMRQRINARLAQEQEKNPHSQHLRRQRILMERSHISTIHAFCLDLISRHTQELDIPMDFILGDDSRLKLLKEEAVSQAIETFYSADADGSFAGLVELLSGGRDDSRVTQTIYKLYDFIRSHPFYEDWLAEKEALYHQDVSVGETVWGKIILDYAGDAVTFCLEKNREMLAQMEGIPELIKAYGPSFFEDGQNLQALGEILATRQWDECCDAVQNFTFGRLGALRGFSDDGLKAGLQFGRDQIKKILKSLAQRQFCATAQEFAEDLEDLRPKISTLFSLTLAYDQILSAHKTEQKILEFSDLEHFALRLLMRKEGNRYLPTSLAKQLAKEFWEVLVDEYQDTNSAQDMLFRALSRDESNLFMVGDVKQSIYRFRQAMPEIFLEKMERYAPFDGQHYPTKIILGKNFRSRAQVTDFVNFVFAQLMSGDVGDMEYTNEQRLIPAADYPEEASIQTEIHLIDTQESEKTAAEEEAIFIAQEISKLMTSGTTVWENGAERPLRFGDLCVLLRSPKNKAQIYRDAFLKVGIHSWTDNKGGFLGAREVVVMTALLRVLDNPYRDIPLLTVLMSDLYGFSPEKIAQIRLLQKQGAFFTGVQKSAQAGDEECKNFIQQTAKLRRFAASMPVAALLTEIYAVTDYPAIVSAYPMGEYRRANLHQLCRHGEAFEKSGGRGLYPFVRFLDRLEEQNADLATASTGGAGEDRVAVMSIHRSKGLEFPYVFLCDCGKAFNKQDQRERIALHPQLGFACVRRDMELLKEFTTVPLEALRLENERASLSEELRVLYVALTRAKEKLYITMAGNTDRILKKAASAGEGALSPFSVRGADSMGVWLLMCALRHPDCGALREKVQAGKNRWVPAQTHLSVCFHTPAAFDEGTAAVEEKPAPREDPAILKALLAQSQWRYPYEAATKIPRKLGVSAVAKNETVNRYAFTKTPGFLSGRELSAAQRGDALHHFMQFANYENSAKNPAEELSRLQRLSFLTQSQAEVIDLKRIEKFFHSPLYQRIQAAQRVERELRFLWEFDSRRFGYDGTDTDKITVQGVADCVFWEDGQLVIVDYKTDVVPTAQALAERYREQLRIYKMILSESLQTPVKSCILYSFHLGQEILL